MLYLFLRRSSKGLQRHFFCSCKHNFIQSMLHSYKQLVLGHSEQWFIKFTRGQGYVQILACKLLLLIGTLSLPLKFQLIKSCSFFNPFISTLIYICLWIQTTQPSLTSTPLKIKNYAIALPLGIQSHHVPKSIHLYCVLSNVV